jgi:ABC-type transport system substrate-binding protein
MDDLEFRRALALAVDRERVNELFNENLSQIADSILPPAMPGYLADRDELEYDPQGAKAALEASSYADQAPEIAMNVTGYGDSDYPYLDTLIQMWRESLGVEVVIDYIDPRNAIEGLHEADGHVVVGGWCADYPDPENFLDILFHSGSIFNAANYDNPEIDALLEGARLEFDTARRIELYQQIETILLEDYAIIPMHHSVIYTLVNPRIEGYVLPPAGAPIVHLLSIVDDNP